MVNGSLGQSIIIFVGRNLDTEASQSEAIFIASAAAFVGITIVLLISSLVTAVLVWHRIRQISSAAEEIVHGDLSQRLPVGERRSDFDHLAESLNVMLDRIARLLKGMKEVSDNIAHDLRTPLYRLRSRIELALVNVGSDPDAAGPREALETALKEADRLLGTFNALLSIARLESGAMRGNLIDVDLAEVVSDVAELFEPAADERAITLIKQTETGLMIKGNRELIIQALSNLVDNALKYSPEGGQVVVAARRAAATRMQRDAIDLLVADHGPGIPAADRTRVLERFVRLDHGHGKPGSGLGLSLVAAIASLHEAELTLENTSEGRGLTVRLRFSSP